MLNYRTQKLQIIFHILAQIFTLTAATCISFRCPEEGALTLFFPLLLYGDRDNDTGNVIDAINNYVQISILLLPGFTKF